MIENIHLTTNLICADGKITCARQTNSKKRVKRAKSMEA